MAEEPDHVPLNGGALSASDLIHRARERLRLLPGGPEAGRIATADRPGTRLLTATVIAEIEEGRAVADTLDRIRAAPDDPTLVERNRAVLERQAGRGRETGEDGKQGGRAPGERSVLSRGAAGLDALVGRVEEGWNSAVDAVPALKYLDDGVKAVGKRLHSMNLLRIDLAIVAAAGANSAFAAALPVVEMGLITLAGTCAGASYLRATTPIPMTADETMVMDRMRARVPEPDFLKFLAANDLTMRDSEDGRTTYYRPPLNQRKVRGKEADELREQAAGMNPEELRAFADSRHLRVHTNGVSFYREADAEGGTASRVRGSEAKALMHRSNAMDPKEFQEYLAENGYSMRTNLDFYRRAEVEEKALHTYYRGEPGRLRKLPPWEGAALAKMRREMTEDDFATYLAEHDVTVRTQTKLRAADRPGLRCLNAMYDALPSAAQKAVHSEAMGATIEIGTTIAGVVAILPMGGMQEVGIGLAAGATAVLATEHGSQHKRRQLPSDELTPYYSHRGVDYRLGEQPSLSAVETKEALKAMGLDTDPVSAALLRKRNRDASAALLYTPVEFDRGIADAEDARKPFFMRQARLLLTDRAASAGG